MAGSLAAPDMPFAVVLGPECPVPDTLGGKGSALGRLIADGLPVPGTGVVTTTAYREIAEDPSIRTLVDQVVGGADLTAEQVDEVFASAPVPEAVAAAVVDLAASVGDGGPVAVRSSATVEDMHGSSFAGQYRSLLDVDSTDPDDVLTAVRQVWASLWHPAPSAYREAFGIDQSDVAMAVVVMRMIPATTAGVVFTEDPGGSGGARVESVEGLGESLVSGQRTPSAWVVDGVDGVPPSSLPAAPAKALELANLVAEQAETPQDVEWAAVGDEVFVVQARPITVLEDSDGFDTPIDEHELTTAGIVEMVPGVLPALRWELNRFLLEEAFRSVLDSLGIIRGRAAEDRAFVRRVRGRAAIDFDQLRDAAEGVPGAVAELERQYFGEAAELPADRTDGRAPGWANRLGLTALERDLRTLQTRRQVIEQSEVLIKATAGLGRRRPNLGDLDDRQLIAYIRRVTDLAARGLAAELGVAAAGAAAYQRLEAQLASHLGPKAGAAAALAVTARTGASLVRSPAASAAIFAGPTWSELPSGPPRARPPAQPSAPDPDSDADPDTDAADAGWMPPAGVGDPWHLLQVRLRSLPGWTRRRILTGGVIDVRMHLIRRLIEDVTEQLGRRESAKAAVLELGGEVRRVMLALGDRLVARGVLNAAEEVELLTSAELLALCTDGSAGTGTTDGTASIGGAAGTVAAAVAPDVLRRRRNWISRYEAEGALPVRFTGVPDREPEALPEGDVLTGWAASPGRRRGIARVVTSATGHLDNGEILVAGSTDASWSPLFMRAGAVIVERGGPLSHAAILARELGLPAVLNVASATRVLGGHMVSVDGDRGAVVIEDGEAAS